MIEFDTTGCWQKNPSNISGLTYIPTIEPEYCDSDQRRFVVRNGQLILPLCTERKQKEDVPLVTNGPSVRQSHVDLIKSVITDATMSILEIGVDQHPQLPVSTTKGILRKKTDKCTYLGIDVRKKPHLRNPKKNIHTMAINSTNRKHIREQMLAIGIDTIDLIVIDGNHSITMVVNDWCFTEFLSPRGIVIMHDTNVHIGPLSVFDAIDEKIFDKHKTGTDMKSGKFVDYGMGIARRLS